jgi:hypothetical protein
MGGDDPVDMKKSVHTPATRLQFERSRLSVLSGLFAHTAAAVAYALTSLPLVVICVQVGDAAYCDSVPIRPYVTLAVLALSCMTLATVFLVLAETHALVEIDSRDTSDLADID